MEGEVKKPTEGISSLIENVARGNFKEDVNNKLRTLIEAIALTGKGGKLTLEINIKPNRSTGSVEVSGVTKINAPVQQPPASIFFITEDNSLSRHDARQNDMFISNNAA